MPPPDETIPVIDIAALVVGDAAGERMAAQRIGQACRGIGFFYITGHGVAPEIAPRVFAAAADFFQGPAPIEEKRFVQRSGRQPGLHQAR